ncbi:hypothetical protein ACFX2H_034037 [Malus domestica]
MVQETKLSKNTRLTTYALSHGRPNPRWGWADLSHIEITKPTTSIEDSNNIDTTASSPHSPDGIDSAALNLGRSNGLCLWWKDGTTIQILSANKYVIDTCIQEKSVTTPIHISWFYGPPHNHQKIFF